MKVEIYRHQKTQPWTYADLDARQREIARDLLNGGDPILLISELSPIITRGRRTPEEDVKTLGLPHSIEMRDVDRGGLATYHGPGQWVVFPVHRLETSTGDRRGVRKAIYALLEVAASVGRLYQSSIEIREGAELGVWTDHGKFAAVGIHIKNGILLHGLSVNGFKTPESFCGLRPCGLDAPIDFLISEQEQAVGLKTREELFLELKEELIAATLKRFSPNRAEPHPPL